MLNNVELYKKKPIFAAVISNISPEHVICSKSFQDIQIKSCVGDNCKKVELPQKLKKKIDECNYEGDEGILC